MKGIVRRTSLASYRTADPQWETVLDIDALAKAEGKSWVYGGMQCLPPDERRCLVSLSPGGRDATVVREFDLTTSSFVAGRLRARRGQAVRRVGQRGRDHGRRATGAPGPCRNPATRS